ncbi:MAG TPA: DUF4920 domain-containing protein [Saprospiraceae bacterium]|nr:DUF4920 domain-containing protein [Saprospiraceae bacterium]HMQ84425.1 DUF4920 domain-containing protein [Saprospiraceae bacterium]
MILRNSCLLILAAALFSCGSPQQTSEAQEANPVKIAGTFGETITPDNAIAYDQLLKEFGTQDSVATKVVGQVTEVCQVKGCWMNILNANGEGEPMMVRFKDYGFFMPKDIAGKKVIIEGYAFREVTPVDELRHYAEDAGKSADEIAAITEPKEELKFLASGVLLLED